MEKIKQNYDRVLLIVIGLITLIAGAMLAMKSFAVANQFPDVDEGESKELTDTGVDEITAASEHVTTPKEWKPTGDSASNKVFRLMSSVPIVAKGEKIIDLSDDDQPVREGMTNSYILKHKLPFRRDDMPSMDLDDDGFTNLEENTQGATDPRDKDDFPDATGKLVLSEVVTEPYIVMFGSSASGRFNVKRMAPEGQVLAREDKWSAWGVIDGTFPDKTLDANRFKVLSYVEKDVHQAATSRNRKNVGALTVEDTKTGGKIELTQRDKVNIPIYKAKFTYSGPGTAKAAVEGNEYLPGDAFPLSGTGLAIEIESVSENKVTLKVTEQGKNPRTITKELK